KPWSLARQGEGAAALVPDSRTVPGTVGAAGVALPNGLAPGGPLMLEVTGLRVINVENLAPAERDGPPEDADSAASKATDARGVNLAALTEHLGSGAKAPGDKTLVNVGPSVTYKLRDNAGQAREYQNYMMPVTLGGQPVFLLG